MGLLDSVKSLPVLILVALICLVVANLFNGIAFSTTAWGESYFYIFGSFVVDPTLTYTNFGLWRSCTGSQTGYALNAFGTCTETYVGTAQGWMAAVQAFAVFGFAGMLGALILMVAYLLGSKNGDYVLFAALLCIITAVLYLIGLIIFGVKFYSQVLGALQGRSLGWSYGLAVVAFILELVSGILLIVGRKGGATSPS